METKRDLFRNDIQFSMMSEKQINSEFDITKKGGSYRMRNGRFASKYDAFKDKYSRKMQWLAFEREKYMRAWLAVCERLASVERENIELKKKIMYGNES